MTIKYDLDLSRYSRQEILELVNDRVITAEEVENSNSAFADEPAFIERLRERENKHV